MGKFSDAFPTCSPYLFWLCEDQLVSANSTLYGRISSQWLNELRRLGPSVSRPAACKLVSHTMPKCLTAVQKIHSKPVCLTAVQKTLRLPLLFFYLCVDVRRFATKLYNLACFFSSIISNLSNNKKKRKVSNVKRRLHFVQCLCYEP